MELDHVLVAVADLEAAAIAFESRYGLASVEGGRHVGWGTANRIVPLGETYLELISVVDHSEAATSVVGRWVAAASPGAPLGWAVRTNDLDAIAERLGLTPLPGSRPTADGRVLRWRGAGLERAAREASLPFFIEWAPDSPFPGRIPVAHPAVPTGIAKVVVEGDPMGLSSWLGDTSIPVEVRPGRSRVAAVVIASHTDDIVVA